MQLFRASLEASGEAPSGFVVAARKALEDTGT